MRILLLPLAPSASPFEHRRIGPPTLTHGRSYIVKDGLCYLTLCERSYPRKLAFAYLADLANEFNVSHQPSDYLAPGVKSFAYVGFERTIHKTMKTYQDSRMPANLDRLNDELKDVTKVMTKNIEDLLYRGDSLERMGDISSRLREDSRKYRKAAVRINWELLLKQVSGIISRPPQACADANCAPVRAGRRAGVHHNRLHLVAVLLRGLGTAIRCITD